MKSSAFITQNPLTPAALLALLGLIGCLGNPDSTGPASSERACSTVIAKLRSCDVLSDGVAPPCELDASNPNEQCEFACYAQASCVELNQLICEDDEENTLAACITACETAREASPLVFTCTDNSVANLTPRDQCDGWEDCFDASDELNCPEGTRFSCRDNTEMIPGSFQCDGEADCPDGSDEVNCPVESMFKCANGQSVAATDRCDRHNDCGDGSDELGCATLCEER